MSASPSSTSPAAKSVAILGAGITGLAAAHRLATRGYRIRVFEASDHVGGSIRTERSDGWLVEGGPNTLLGGDPALNELIAEAGLADERVEANATARNRFIVRGGRPLAAPLSPPAAITTPLLSFAGKMRIFGDLFARRRVRTSDISLEEFIAAHFGQELVDYALNPFVSGVYAGTPKKLSARHSFPQLWELEQQHGSIIRGQMAAAKARKASGQPRPKRGIFSFRQGLAALPQALAASLPVGTLTLNARVEALVPGPAWSVVWRGTEPGAPTQTDTFDLVLSALPAAGLAQLRFGTLGERPLASLDAIDHPPVSSLFLGYRRDQVTHALDGFGVLVPEIEHRSVLGILFSSSLFPGRAPDGHVALTVMAGGMRQPEIARLPEEKLLATVDRDLRELLGVKGEPVFRRHNFWPRAIPQYNLGYERHLETMAAAERNHPGFFIGGQVRDGIAVPACIAAGEKLAQRVLRA
ncbi:protoporphyrinogen oxidase [Opitutus sp. ER46]|uniref:protoporphyrinogen oxidase n=1 Tax=Opitutus sp. ER46 TaxID=2161864 RepID=UPI001E56C76B|nr:protoporphyrinogen oxidase [Opitutus sp. ER46]